MNYNTDPPQPNMADDVTPPISDVNRLDPGSQSAGEMGISPAQRGDNVVLDPVLGNPADLNFSALDRQAAEDNIVQLLRAIGDNLDARMSAGDEVSTTQDLTLFLLVIIKSIM